MKKLQPQSKEHKGLNVFLGLLRIAMFYAFCYDICFHPTFGKCYLLVFIIVFHVHGIEFVDKKKKDYSLHIKWIDFQHKVTYPIINFTLFGRSLLHKITF